MTRANEYTWIEKWAMHMGSSSTYIREQQHQAAQDKAPINATHRNADKTWSTTDDILSVETRMRLGLPLEPAGTVGRQVRVEVVVAYRVADYNLNYDLPEGDKDAPEYVMALVQEAVREKLQQLGWGCVPGVRIVNVMPGREREMRKAEEAAALLRAQP